MAEDSTVHGDKEKRLGCFLTTVKQCADAKFVEKRINVSMTADAALSWQAMLL
jgi:hypothetical protein